MPNRREMDAARWGLLMGGVIGAAIGTSLFRAWESGGEWWLFPPVLIGLLVCLIWKPAPDA